MQETFGYAREPTTDQNLDTQLEALEKAGCYEIFQEKLPLSWPLVQNWIECFL